MGPNRKPEDRLPPDGPVEEQADWDEVEGGELRPGSLPENFETDYEVEPSGDLPGEDDDNPYQESDEALPDDADERVLSRNPGKEGSKFDDV
ncbi:hypothetical protein [Aquamicrobium sp. LC103]|uniref:hypothetical protein n=1 Tax=Aquamicrobium sp. LC103 TaxID=1120658 RepID=UPI00063E9897|nr:hypothetical protein [Aquamicrobium sp. LC103]TKT69720.1 hypothetical protein XW59_026670 [Aquamicrobium sp. LC103]